MLKSPHAIRGFPRTLQLTAVLCAAILTATVSAQSPPGDGSSPASVILDPNVVPASCASCGLGGSGGQPGGLPGCDPCYGGGCDGPRCVPGRYECCSDCDSCSAFGRLWCGLKGSFCCPDPCYQPCYIPVANAGMFVDSAKPVNQTVFRWDAGRGGTTPDRAEYFWSRIGGRGPANRESRVNYHELQLYGEAAVDRFSIFIQQPYRSLDPTNNPHAAGFMNLSIGTKSLMIDSEIFMLSFQFKTFIPTANARKGIDNGHVSLEPSLLATLKVMPLTYLQAQLSEWIPIAGDPAFAGAMLHYHFSLNHVMAKPSQDLQFIGTLEFGGYSFQDGLFSPFPAGAPVRANRFTYFNLGPGFRLVFCKKLDIGFGMQFGLTANHFAQELYRTELRWRF